MKNTITTFALVLAAFVAVNLLMSFAKPVLAPDEPKQYIVLRAGAAGAMGDTKNLEMQVNQKLAEGWHLQGGVAFLSNQYSQAMTK